MHFRGTVNEKEQKLAKIIHIGVFMQVCVRKFPIRQNIFCSSLWSQCKWKINQ